MLCIYLPNIKFICICTRLYVCITFIYVYALVIQSLEWLYYLYSNEIFLFFLYIYWWILRITIASSQYRMLSMALKRLKWSKYIFVYFVSEVLQTFLSTGRTPSAILKQTQANQQKLHRFLQFKLYMIYKV